MLMLGLAGEYIGRIYLAVNQYPQYVIKNKINITQQNIEVTDDINADDDLR